MTLTEAIKPYPYQLEDIQELIERPRVILGSVMRAGKMYEVCELVKRLDLQNILVICPKPMVAEWIYKIEEWLGPLWLKRFDVFNYAKLRRPDLTSLIRQTGYQLIVLDECHKVKNRKAQQTIGAWAIASSSPRLILASGTPFENSPDELWSLLHMIDPPTFPSYWRFVEHFCIVHQLPKPPYPRIIEGPKNKIELRELLHKYMLRREKGDLRTAEGTLVVKDRAPQRTIPVELTDAQLLNYQTMEEELFALLDSGERIGSPKGLAQLTRLRQICLEPNLLSEEGKVSSPSAKTEVVLELMEDADAPILIVTCFEKYARILAVELTKAGYKVGLYTGTVSEEDKHQTVLGFQRGDYQALVATIQSVGLGLTLTKGYQIIFTDEHWNPQVNDQCISRLEGSGQSRPVEVVDLWARGTVEDHLHCVLARKEKWFKEIISPSRIWEEVIKERRRDG